MYAHAHMHPHAPPHIAPTHSHLATNPCATHLLAAAATTSGGANAGGLLSLMAWGEERRLLPVTAALAAPPFTLTPPSPPLPLTGFLAAASRPRAEGACLPPAPPLEGRMASCAALLGPGPARWLHMQAHHAA